VNLRLVKSLIRDSLAAGFMSWCWSRQDQDQDFLTTFSSDKSESVNGLSTLSTPLPKKKNQLCWA